MNGWMHGYRVFMGRYWQGGLLSRVTKSCSGATLCTASELAWHRMAQCRGYFQFINF